MSEQTARAELVARWLNESKAHSRLQSGLLDYTSAMIDRPDIDADTRGKIAAELLDLLQTSIRPAPDRGDSVE